MFGGHCLVIAKISRFMKQIRHLANLGRNIEEKALARHCKAQDFKMAQETSLDLFLGL